MDSTQRLTFVIPAMTGGGAERQMSYLANHAAATGYNCSLITLSSNTADAYSLDPRIDRIGLDVMRESCGFWESIQTNRNRIRLLKKAILDCHPDGVVSFCDKMNIMTLAAVGGSSGRNIPVIIGERSDPRKQHLGWFWETLRRFYYPKCSASVVQTAAVGEYLKKIIGTSKPVHVVPTAFQPENREHSLTQALLSSDKTTSVKRLLYAGRLSNEKGIDRLLAIWPALHERFPVWRLLVAGEGAEKEHWLHTNASHPSAASIDWLGWVPDLRALMASCDAFVLPSQYEGFPNALIEAMDCGLPCVATDCSASIREFMVDNVSGIIVGNDPQSLMAGLDRLLKNQTLRAQLSKNASHAVSPYSWPMVSPRWDKVLQSFASMR